MLIMPPVKGDAFNACWLDKGSSLQPPNLNIGGGVWGGAGNIKPVRGGGGGDQTPHIQIQICRSWVKPFQPRENSFPGCKCERRILEICPPPTSG